MKNINLWRVNGKYFGYPKCCIDEFIEDKHQGHPTCTEDLHKCYGFIPCEKHRQDILDGVIKLEELITNRVHKDKFPNDGY